MCPESNESVSCKEGKLKKLNKRKKNTINLFLLEQGKSCDFSFDVGFKFET